MKQKIIVADRNDPRYIPKKKYMRIIRDGLYLFADGIVVQNKGNMQYFSQAVQRKSTVIYNPVEMENYRGRALTAAKKKRIVSIGRTIPQKNQIILLNAFANMKKKYPDYTLTIYGKGPLRNELKKHARELSIDGAVEFPGAVKDVHDKVLDAEIFVLCSNYEGMPNALIEAMVLGLPVISTKVSGATDLILNGQNGLLIDVGDTAALEDAMLKFIENDSLRKMCAQHAVAVADMLKVDVITEQWEEFITSVLRKGRE